MSEARASPTGDEPEAKPAPATQTTRCITCKQEILAGASLCSVCKSYQRPWKNHLLYFSGIAVMIALVVSAATWFWGTGRLLLGLVATMSA
jgi:hypothetical protein